MSTEPASAVERARALGIDVSLLLANLRLSPTERLRRGEAFARFAWSVREQGRQSRELQPQDAASPDRKAPDQAL